MMLPPNLINSTDVIIVVGTALILALDAWLLQRRGEGGTISARVAYWALRAPVVALVVGILVGHLFWPNRAYCEKGPSDGAHRRTCQESIPRRPR